MNVPAARIATPCIGICELGADGLCVGCRRTGAEIARWRELDDSERRRLMDEILPARRGGSGAAS
ncbi:MAG: DUF1289 domain-containing protein [Dokdonella sp.]|uniref:DUF1289 domain-containing protein n=1 Tax=Dokdonella sp. TaxID=2291710 RepID=UPI0025B87584|nr:DUF1289 domain-containing protein [Dokdonella sp.]MBX3701651.1 DUF1289 domain-containing protein [Dokdonella sp.]